ncbi:hypothetical protein ABN028_19930 [Actinopolymorpha sp. B17G11]|uniref:hypothetical protein n=1 Tax=Actinopolymorpha sp. B17G11 TaxID=3160861 RepID=UPI0032E48F5B
MSTFEEQDEVFIEKPEGFEQIPQSLYLDTTVSDGELRMYIVISHFGGRQDRAMPGRKTLAKAIGKGPGTVDARLNGLVKAGWLLITPRWRDGGKGQTSNSYQLLWHPIREADDPRLLKHKLAVTKFEQQMAAARKRNEGQKTDEPAGEPKKTPRLVRTASWRPVSENREGGSSQDPDTGGYQKTDRGPSQENQDGGVSENREGPSQDSETLYPHQGDPDLDRSKGSDSSLRSESAGDESDESDALFGPGLKAVPDQPKAEPEPGSEEWVKKRATEGATWWHNECKKRGIKIMVRGSSRPFVALRDNVLKPAFRAGYDAKLIAAALERIQEPLPAWKHFERVCQEMDGKLQPRYGSGSRGTSNLHVDSPEAVDTKIKWA